MQIAFATLRLLQDGKFHSGTTVAHQLGVSRSSVWKGIRYLRQLAILIQSVPGKGYRWHHPFELLDKNQIALYLENELQQKLPRMDLVNVVPSTNDYLMKRLTHNIPSGTVCIAESQTAGKGRMGKKWHSPFGANLYLSLYWHFPGKLMDLSGLSLVVGLAVLLTLQELGPLPPDIGIKWPNDIWHQNAKLCGILLESSQDGKSLGTDVIIGLGINVKMPSNLTDVQWTDLTQICGFLPSRNKLTGLLLNKLVTMLLRFQQQGFQPFIPLWLQYDLLLGREVQIFAPNHVRTGIAQGVNERGELCIKIGETLQAIRYGEVSVRPESKIIS